MSERRHSIDTIFRKPLRYVLVAAAGYGALLGCADTSAAPIPESKVFGVLCAEPSPVKATLTYDTNYAGAEQIPIGHLQVQCQERDGTLTAPRWLGEVIPDHPDLDTTMTATISLDLVYDESLAGGPSEDFSSTEDSSKIDFYETTPHNCRVDYKNVAHDFSGLAKACY